MQTYFRVQSADEHPQDLLDPDKQWTKPWDGGNDGVCDKCGGTGSTEHECETCTTDTPDPDCPSCAGKVTYERVCPACKGTGEAQSEPRRGVSVFPEVEPLLRYLARRGGHMDGCTLVELAGERSPEEDFDADEGALLVMPEEIVSCRKLRDDEIAAAREAAGAA